MVRDEESNLSPQSPSADFDSPPQIDGIEIISLLGRGGMSVVYKARQMQLDRIVALKVLSKVMLSEDGITRFQREAKNTSVLEHPNIVKTIGFGLCKEGRPFLLLEYLEGLSLASELRQHGRLNLRKFKDVFLPALSALGQAHQAGIVHRDIKPANIMLCTNDTGAETVKLVDFGIAKISLEVKADMQDHTKTGVLLGSPSYMSPEQCLGKPLDGRSDLYSLACVMYEALNAEPPFSGNSAMEVMQKHVLEQPPTLSDFCRKVEIRKDLAEVILMALAKDPGERPQTAFEFAEKLKEALEDTTLDRVPKLKVSSAALSGAFTRQALIVTLGLLFAGAIAFVLIGSGDHNSGNQKSTQRSKKSEFEHSLQRELKTANIRHGSGRIEQVQELDKEAVVYLQHGVPEKGAPLLEKALAMAEDEFGQNDPRVAEILLHLGSCRLQQQNKAPSAEPLFKRVIAIRKKTFGPNNSKVSEALLQLAICYNLEGRWAEAKQEFENSLSIGKKALGPNDIFVGACLASFGMACVKKGLYEDAEPRLKSAIAIEEVSLGPSDVLMADPVEALAECYDHKGRYVEAESLFNRSLAVDEGWFGPDSPVVGRSLLALGICYCHQGFYAKAEPIIKHSLAICEKEPTPGIDTAKCQNALAICYAKQGKQAEAELLFKQARDITRSIQELSKTQNQN